MQGPHHVAKKSTKQSDDEKYHSFLSHSGVDSQHNGRIIIVQLPHLQYACHQCSGTVHCCANVYLREHYHERRLSSLSSFYFRNLRYCDVPIDALLYAPYSRQLVRDSIAGDSVDRNGDIVCDTQGWQANKKITILYNMEYQITSGH